MPPLDATQGGLKLLSDADVGFGAAPKLLSDVDVGFDKPPPPPPPSSMLGGVTKVFAQAPSEFLGKLAGAEGAAITSVGTGVQSAASNAESFTRQQADVIRRIDAGDTVPAMDDPLGYADANADQKAEIRDVLARELARMPAPQDTLLGRAGGAVKTLGENIRSAGQATVAAGEAAHPLTEEETGRTSVIGAKLLTGLVPYLGAAVVGGLPAVIGLAGTQGFGEHYDAAKKAGGSDEDAAIAGSFGGLVNAGMMTVPIGKAMEVAATLPGAFKGEFLKTIWKMAESGATLTAFSQLQTVADNVVAQQTYDPTRSPTKGLGENLGPQFAVGALLPGVGAAMGGAARLAGRLRPNVQPRPDADAVFNAPDLDTAISTAREVAITPGEPVVPEDFSAPLDTGPAPPSAPPLDASDPGQAKLTRLFNETDVGTEMSRPMEVWNPSDAAEPVEGEPPTIAPETAHAIQDHYGQAGIDVVFYKEDPAIQFDGAVDRGQPDTIFLSNNPSRNIAQVAGHEFTHVLSTTTLPDGTSLGELLNQQIAAGITPAGLNYARKTFGSTAPAREGFDTDEAHAAAVQAHLINELGTDIGGEAPKFQSFLPRVISAIQQRFGDSVAGDVLTKLMDGLRSAMETIRGLYGESGTRSQLWVTNIGEIHDTLAKMYAERFGTPVEREQAAQAAMRDKAERDRFVVEQPPGLKPIPKDWRFVAEPVDADGYSTVTLRDAAGTVHYQAQILEDSPGIFGLSQIENISRSQQGIGAAFYRDIADYVNARGGKLYVGIDATPFAETAHAALGKVGALRKVSPEEAIKDQSRSAAAAGMSAQEVRAEIADRNIFEVLPRDAASSKASEALGAQSPGLLTYEPGPPKSVLTLRRWLDELAAERDAKAASTPMANVLKQTEAVILHPVGGDEAALPEPAKVRLDQVRQQIDEVSHPQGDTPEMAKVRAALVAQIKARPEPVESTPTAPLTPQEAYDAADKAYRDHFFNVYQKARDDHTARRISTDEFLAIREEHEALKDRVAEAQGRLPVEPEKPEPIDYSVAEMKGWWDGLSTRERGLAGVGEAEWDDLPTTSHDALYEVREKWDAEDAETARRQQNLALEPPEPSTVRKPPQTADEIRSVQEIMDQDGVSESDALQVQQTEIAQFIAEQPGTKPPTPTAEKPPAEAENWWRNELTQYGRRLVMNRASINKPDRVLWQALSLDERARAWAAREAGNPLGGGATRPFATGDTIVAKPGTGYPEGFTTTVERVSQTQEGNPVVKIRRGGTLITINPENFELSAPRKETFFSGTPLRQWTKIGTNYRGEILNEATDGLRSIDNRVYEQAGTDRANHPEFQVAEWHGAFPDRAPEYKAPEAPLALDADARLAERIATRLERENILNLQSLTARELQRFADEAYGGTLASGAYTHDRLYDAIELGVNRYIQKHPAEFSTNVPAERAQQIAAVLAGLKERLPTQTVRAGEKDAYQQFSTPPDYAYAAAWVASVRPGDHILEPSAGTGSLFVHGQNAGGEVTANELSAKRRGMLAALGPDRVTGEDAAQLHNILPAEIKPTVVLMNPPFSRAAERMGNAKVLDEGFKHVDQALKRLQPGGRLVAIVGDSLGRGVRGAELPPDTRLFQQWRARTGALYAFRADIRVGRDIYSKYGTSFPTRLLVIDKIPPGDRAMVTGTADTAAELIDRLKDVRDERAARGAGEQATDQSGRPGLAPGGEGEPRPPGVLPGPTGELGAGDGPGLPVSPNQPAAAPTGVRPGVRRPPRPRTRPGEGGAGDQPPPVESQPEPGGAGGESAGGTSGGGRPRGGGEAGGAGGPRTDDGGPPVTDGSTNTIVTKDAYEAAKARMKERMSRLNAGFDPALMLDGLTMATFHIERGLRNFAAYSKAMLEDLGDTPQVRRLLAPIYRLARDTTDGLHGLDDDAAIAKALTGELPEPPPEKLKAEIILPDPEHGGELTESVYEPYRPQRLNIEGAQPHPGPLVQSAAMASVLPPEVRYNVALPRELITSGKLSEAQLEAIVYAGAAHANYLPVDADAVTRRRGFFIGDGTGVGKGREVSGIILDNWMRGTKKALWISEKMGLLKDAQRDWTGLEQNANDIFSHGKIAAPATIGQKQGILFTTYSTLRGGEKISGGAAALKPGSPVSVMRDDGELSANGTLEGVRKTKQGDTIYSVRLTDGSITEVPKALLGDATGKLPQTRLQQIVNWLGKDYDGVIAFDEAHNLGNAVPTKGSRGTKAVAEQALAGIELQKLLPNARVVYVSATGATEVSNLAYADRLGLWGKGTAFANRNDFIGKISGAGLAGMELVARDMKALGHYIARSLSYDGVEYDRMVHELTPQQTTMYDTIAESWQHALREMTNALETTGQTDDSGRPLPGSQKSNVLSAFWGGHQRFFNQLITSMQMPTLLKGVERDLAEGRQVVLQMVNTNEAGQTRAMDQARAEGEDDLEELDMSPKRQLMDLAEKSFPIFQMEQYADDHGNIGVRFVKDSKGNPVINPEAVAARDKLLLDLARMNVPSGPLDILIDHFGPDAIAEVTGRKSRIVNRMDENGDMKRVEDKRGAGSNESEAQSFQDGKKKILVFTGAGSTGRSYHADNTSPSADARRAHYVVQPGWRADSVLQGLGRTHRTNQASPPIVHLMTTNLEGQKRFISSVARRLSQLGALTKGERRTGDQGIFGAMDNLESDQAKAALTQFFNDVQFGRVSDVDTALLTDQMGLKLHSETGSRLFTPPTITQFLNRVLSLKVDLQNKVFGAFSERMAAIVQHAMENGTLDAGTETFRADKINKVSDKVVYTDPESGAETRHVKLQVSKRNHPVSFEDVQSGQTWTTGYQNPAFYVRNIRSGLVSAVTRSPYSTTSAEGQITDFYRVGTPLRSQLVKTDDLAAALDKKSIERVPDLTAAKQLWDDRVSKIPDFSDRDLHLITGAVLPVWDRLGGSPKIYRLRTDDTGERMLGRVIDNKNISKTLQRLGAGEQVTATPAQIVSRLHAGETATLANGWKIERRNVAGEWRLELSAGRDSPSLYDHAAELRQDGVFEARIGYSARYFIPTGDRAAEVLKAITDRRPVTILGKEGEDEDAEEDGDDRGVQFSPRSDDQEARAPGRMRSDPLTSRDMAHLNDRADVTSPRDFILAGHDDPDQLAAVILPDGRLFQFKPDAYDAETSHQGFNDHTDGNNYAEITAYKGSIGVSVQGDSSPAMEQTINRLRFQATREGVDFHTDEDLYGSRTQFSPRVAVRDERETEQWTPEQAEAYAHVGRAVEQPIWRDRIASMTDDLGRRFIRAVVDPYIGVKRDDPEGYVALRNANTTAHATEMFLTDGTLKFSGTTYAMDQRNGGVEHALIRPLHGEQDRFIWWVAANRAERLSAEDRENLWSREDIDIIKATNQGQVPFDYTLPNGQVTRSREAVYLDSLRKLDEFNKNTLDLAVQSGLLNGERIDALYANPFYVPFYRVAEEDGRFGGGLAPGFVKQYAFKQLKGGTAKLNNDLWDNAVRNWSHLIDASLRNKAAAGVLDTAVTNGAAAELSARDIAYQSKAEKKNTVWVMNDGQKQSFLVTDPMLFHAISALSFTGFHNPVMNALTKFKTVMTMGVTSSPLFMLRTSIRDAEQAMATAPTSYNPIKTIMTGYQMADLPGAVGNALRAVAGQQSRRLNLSDETANLIAAGGTMRLGSGHDTGARTTSVDTMLDSSGKIAAFWDKIANAARAYKEVAAQSEDVQRFALGHKLLAEGAPLDKAAFAARDLEDFSLKGAGTVVRFLTQTVPFMNAWLQGLYKVGRAAADSDRNITLAVGSRIAVSATRRLAVVLGATTMATLALDAIYADDEDYKKRPDYDRDANYWFKIGGVQFRIPMGFEIAAMSRIAANGIEAFLGTNEMTGRRFFNTSLQIFGTNMSLNPIPQAVKPVFDLMTNTSGTGSPIVGQGMDRLRPEEQYNAATTLLARGASSAGNVVARAAFGPQTKFLSPVQIDYLVNGYTGWLGSQVVNLADQAIRGIDQGQAALRGEKPMEPVRPSYDLWNRYTGGMISTETTPASRYVDMLYQQADGINRTFATYHDRIARGRIDDARDFYAANKDAMARHGLLQRTEQVESLANRQIKRIGEDPKMDAERKHLEIMKYNAMRNRAAENIFGARP